MRRNWKSSLTHRERMIVKRMGMMRRRTEIRERMKRAWRKVIERRDLKSRVRMNLKNAWGRSFKSLRTWPVFEKSCQLKWKAFFENIWWSS